MLVIRPQQYALFEQLSRDNFVQRLAVHLADFGCTSFLDGKLTAIQFAQLALNRCEEVGVSTEFDVVRLAECFAQFGLNLERAPGKSRLRSLLAHPSLPGPAKVDGLIRLLRESTYGRTLVRLQP